MKLYILKRLIGRPVYDANNGFVIRAHDAADARRMASENNGDEGAATWLDPDLSTCAELTDDGERGVILQDFNAG